RCRPDSPHGEPGAARGPRQPGRRGGCGGLFGLGCRRVRHRCGRAGRRRPRHGPVAFKEPTTKEQIVDSDAAFEKFRECAVEVLQVPADKITKEAKFADDLDADSLDLVALVMALEEAFDITVEETELEDITTIGQAFDLISAKL